MDPLTLTGGVGRHELVDPVNELAGQAHVDASGTPTPYLERVHELHRRYFAELRELVARSEPAEVVLLANVQLIRLG